MKMIRLVLLFFSCCCLTATVASPQRREDQLAEDPMNDRHTNGTLGRITSKSTIVGYVPESDVRDQAKIDWDLREVQSQLELMTQQGFDHARQVIEKGGYSLSYATIKLVVPLSITLNKGDRVLGQSESGQDVRGTVFATETIESESLQVAYDADANCHVGGLQGESIKLDGCLAPNGTVSVGTTNTLSYLYNPLRNNHNGRTLSTFSTRAAVKMLSCDLGCPFPEYEVFVNHYGINNYGDLWTQAALAGDQISNPIADFSSGVGNDRRFRAQVVSLGIVFWSIWMFCVGEWREAVAQCLDGGLCSQCNNAALKAWDSGVAFYTGSLVGSDINSVQRGYLIYSIANELCQDMNTCGKDGFSTEGNSKLNRELLFLFTEGRSKLRAGECEATQVIMARIIKVMQIPLIQGLLRSAYKMSNNDRSSSVLGEAAVFLKGLEPLLDQCNTESANVIKSELQTGALTTNFTAVKLALEQTYNCLEVSCADVGGIWDATNRKYREGATPCRPESTAIAGYEPSSTVWDQNIDVDLDAIESLAITKTASSFVTAKQIYQEGGSARSYAILELSQPLSVRIPAGTKVGGLNNNLDAIEGTVSPAVEAGNTKLEVVYIGNNCRVGALPESHRVNNGCFVESGVVVIEGFEEANYTYDATAGNKNSRSLQDFSTMAESTMYNCSEGCPYPEFSKFYRYYGVADYGDQWITASIDGAETNLAKGNADFFTMPGSDLDFRIVAFTRGIVLLNVWMYVIREMEASMNECVTGCTDCNTPSLKLWDQAVATYTGSFVGGAKNSVHSGFLLYSDANKHCGEFKTCGEDGTSSESNSYVNRRIFDLFEEGKTNLQGGNCALGQVAKNKIIELMRIPLIQGTLVVAYAMDPQGRRTAGVLGDAAVHAAAVVPIVHKCSPSDADVIMTNLKVGSSSTSFAAVKAALERNYKCMGVSCENVGGVWDGASQQYFEGAEPCTNSASTVQKIAGYTPTTPVSNLILIDLDQRAIEVDVDSQTTIGFQSARQVYSLGAYSATYADIRLEQKLVAGVAVGVQVESLSAAGVLVKGTIKDGGYVGSESLQVEYEDTGCHVGGLNNIEVNTQGCFAPRGVIEIPNNEPINYFYEPTTDNHNEVTIQSFSLGAAAEMLDCPVGCPHPDFLKYRSYYVDPGYADNWVIAALEGHMTALNSGNIDFSSGPGADLALRAEAVKLGSAFLNIWMYVLYFFESSVDTCQTGCVDCNTAGLNAWDKGVALYAGSLVGQEENAVARGELTYSLANRMCANFRTCGPSAVESEGNSNVNRRLFMLFEKGKRDFKEGSCDRVRDSVGKIANLMKVPLIQATIRYAYTIGPYARRDPETMGKGVTFAASILPLVHACSPSDASLIYDNMRVDANFTDFEEVKQALERNYPCMNLHCHDIGGYWDAATREYFLGAEPCRDAGPTPPPTFPPTPWPTLSPAPTPNLPPPVASSATYVGISSILVASMVLFHHLLI